MRHTSNKQQMCVCVQLCYPCRSFSSRRSAVPLAGKAALHGLQPVSRLCTVRPLCHCVPQGRMTHMGSATPGAACALDVVGTPLRLWGPAGFGCRCRDHVPFDHCRCVPQGRITHMGSATPGTACALDVVGTPLRLWGPAVHEHCPFAGCRWIWLSVSRPCTVRSLCRCVPQGRITHMGSATPGNVARAPAIFSKQREL